MRPEQKIIRAKVDASNALQVADIERILGKAITSALTPASCG
jgi:hypothetical protein